MDNPESRLAGNKITGLRCPIADGTATLTEEIRRTTRRTPSRWAMFRNLPARTSSTGSAPVPQSRSSMIQPPNWRVASANTPTIQTVTIQGNTAVNSASSRSFQSILTGVTAGSDSAGAVVRGGSISVEKVPAGGGGTGAGTVADAG